jgi:hypothetical protein
MFLPEDYQAILRVYLDIIPDNHINQDEKTDILESLILWQGSAHGLDLDQCLDQRSYQGSTTGTKIKVHDFVSWLLKTLQIFDKRMGSLRKPNEIVLPSYLTIGHSYNDTTGSD